MSTTAPPRPLRDQDVEDALGSTAHRRILAACIRSAASVKEVAAATSLPMASAYRNVHALLDNGLLIIERSAMTTDGKPYDLYRARVTEATLSVSAAGVKVKWALNRAVEDRLIHLWSYLR